MSNNDWVQEGTPRDDAEWTDETDDYGVPIEPAEWDDYSAEQAVPVPAPPAQTDEAPVLPEAAEPQADDSGPVTDHANIPTADEPFDAAAEDQPAPTVELGETPEEAADSAAQVDDDEVPAQATVFADERPVDEADEELTREVADGIEDERHHHDGEPIAADADAETDADGYVVAEGATRVESPSAVEPAAAAEPADDEPADDEPTDDEPTTVRDPEESMFGRPADDPEATAALAVPVGAAGAGAGAGALAGLYRADADDTQVLDTTAERRSIDDEVAEEEARAAALRAEKDERDRRLGMVRTSDENAERELRPRRKGVGPFGSFGLFVLRLITAAVLGIVGYQVLYSIDATAEFLTRQPLIPEPRLVAWIVGFTLAAMAVLLVIGFGVRVVGVVLTALAVAALVLVRWGSFSPFVEGMEGFLGDKDLLLAGVGLLFLSLGGGRFGIDGAIHRGREDAREARRN